MRILHVTSGDLWAGAEVQFFYLCRELRNKGVDVHAIIFNEGLLASRLRDTGVSVVVVDESRLNLLQMIVRIGEFLKAFRPEVVHSHGYKENVLLSLANAFTIRANSIRTVHGATEIREPFWRLHKHLFHWLDRFAGRYLQKAIVAVSHPLAELLAQTFAAEKINVIENAIDCDYVRRLSEQVSVIQVDKKAINIAIVGRLVPVKRHDLLLGAISLLAQQYSHLHLYIVGDGPLMKSMRALVQRLQIDARVTFTGALDPVYPVLLQMNLLVMSSDHEGLPMTLLEAMALGVPVIAHGVGGILRVARDGEFVELVQDHSEKGYAAAISAVIANMELAHQRSDRAQEFIKQTYDIRGKCEDYMALYNSVLNRKS